jgi:biotin transport system substrate-specific component
MTAAAAPLLSRVRSRALRVGLVLGGVVLLAVASWVSVPMTPVPMTLQTLAVFAIAGLAGPRLTFEIVAVWLLSAVIGLPVLAGFKGGIAPFTGPTAGFLLAFLIAGPLVAWGAPKTKGGDLFALILAGHALVLVLGWAWLATQVGPAKAFAVGVQPFFFGAIVKSAAATIIVMLAKARIARARKAT